MGAEPRAPTGCARALAAQDGIKAEPGEAACGWLARAGRVAREPSGTTAAENGIAVFELYRPRQSLESVFLELTGGPEAGA